MRFNTVFVCVQTREYSRLVPYVRIQTHEPPQSIRRPPAPHAALLVAQPTRHIGIFSDAQANDIDNAHIEATMGTGQEPSERGIGAGSWLHERSHPHKNCSASQAKQDTWGRRPTRGRSVGSARWSTARSRNVSHRECATRPRARLAGGHRGPGRPFEGYLTASWEGWLMSLGGFQSDIGLVGGTVHRALAVHLLH